MEQLEAHLVMNGFSTVTRVLKYNFWKWLGAKFSGKPTAFLSIRDTYTRDAPLDKGVLGYAVLGSNNAVVYGKANILGRYNNPNILDYINVATHELGHAIFSFGHPKSNPGIMHSHYNNGSYQLIDFNLSHQNIIENSIWGQ